MGFKGGSGQGERDQGDRKGSYLCLAKKDSLRVKVVQGQDETQRKEKCLNQTASLAS